METRIPQIQKVASMHKGFVDREGDTLQFVQQQQVAPTGFWSKHSFYLPMRKPSERAGGDKSVDHVIDHLFLKRWSLIGWYE